MFGCLPYRVQVNHSHSQMPKSVITMFFLSRGLDSINFIYTLNHAQIAIRLHIEP